MITPADVNASSTQQGYGRLTDKVNQIIDGKVNCIGQVNLTAGSTTTVVNDRRAGIDSKILLTPTTANAAATTGLYISSKGKFTFTITHNSNADTDRTFDYAIFG